MNATKLFVAGGLAITTVALIFRKIERNKHMNNLFNKENKKTDDMVKVDEEKLAEVRKARAAEMGIPEIPEFKLNKPAGTRETLLNGENEKEFVSPTTYATATTTTITAARKKELTERIQGMSLEELELVADILPVQLCLKRIDKELERARQFEDTVKKAIGSLA